MTVAVGSEDRLSDAGTRQEVRENRINDSVNIFIDVSSVNPFLVVSGGGGNRKIIALIPVRRSRRLPWVSIIKITQRLILLSKAADIGNKSRRIDSLREEGLCGLQRRQKSKKNKVSFV